MNEHTTRRNREILFLYNRPFSISILIWFLLVSSRFFFFTSSPRYCYGRTVLFGFGVSWFCVVLTQKVLVGDPTIKEKKRKRKKRKRYWNVPEDLVTTGEKTYLLPYSYKFSRGQIFAHRQKTSKIRYKFIRIRYFLSCARGLFYLNHQ